MIGDDGIEKLAEGIGKCSEIEHLTLEMGGYFLFLIESIQKIDMGLLLI